MAQQNKNFKKFEQVPPPKPPPKIFYVGLVLVALAGIEIMGQAFYHYKFSRQENLLLRAFMGLGGTYDPNMVSNYLPHHYMVYVLNPNTQWNYENYYGTKPMQFINSLGYRGKEFVKEKPKGTYRIVCLGGSTTFGLGEPDETQTYPSLLEAKLNARFKGVHFEVINAGTPGWSSGETLINFHFRVLDLSPDMVIEYEGINDTFAMRKPEEGKSDYSTFRSIVHYDKPGALARQFLEYSAACRLLYYYTHTIAFDINSMAVKGSPRGFSEIEQLNKATGKYFRRNIEEIVNIAHNGKIVPVLVTMGHGPWHPSLPLTCRIVRDVAQQKQAFLVDFERYSRPGYFDMDNVHLLRAGNEALAEVIVESFARAGLKFIPRQPAP